LVRRRTTRRRYDELDYSTLDQRVQHPNGSTTGDGDGADPAKPLDTQLVFCYSLPMNPTDPTDNLSDLTDLLKTEFGPLFAGLDSPDQKVSGLKTRKRKHRKCSTKWTRHRKLMLCIASGMTQSEAARVVGMTPSVVSQIARTDAFQAGLREIMANLEKMAIEGNAAEILQKASPMAATELVSLLKAESEQVRKASADSILDRTLGKPVGREISFNLNAEVPTYDPNDQQSIEEAYQKVFGPKNV